MADAKCIYCLRTLPVEAFNTEHVIPEALGKFESNFTLNGVVCHDCNQYFGDSIDRILTRDSIEAYDRIERNLKSVAEIGDVGRKRLTFTVAEKGEWCGMRLKLSSVDGEKAVDFVPQVGFARKDGDGWIYLIEEELTDSARPLPSVCDPNGPIRIIAPDEVIQDRLVALLNDRGVKFVTVGTFLPPNFTRDIEIYAETKIDPFIKRCAAKIVFNYMTYVVGSEFALQSNFDVARAYIRKGELPAEPIVMADEKPILATDSRTVRLTDGHMVTINWTADKRHVVGQLSLFNRVTYHVGLSENFTGLWRPIRSGHHFDLDTRKISPMVATSLVVPRQNS